MDDLLLAVVWGFYAVALFVLYHKVFDVMYFNLGRGLFFEISTCVVASVFLTALTYMYWYITIPVLSVVIVLILKKK